MPVDRYGSTILPRMLRDVMLNGRSHPIEISGRFLRCQIHQNPTTVSMIGITRGGPYCLALGQQWRARFELTLYRNRLAVFPLIDEAKQVIDAMAREVTRTTNLTTMQARDALTHIPQMQADPMFLNGIPPWAGVRGWAAYRYTQDDSILPYLKIHAALDLTLFGSPEKLRASIHRQLDAKLRPTGQPIPPFTPLLTEIELPLDMRNTGIALPVDDLGLGLSRNHILSLDSEGNFICHFHKQNHECDLEMSDLNSCSWGELPIVLRELGDRSLYERVLNTRSPFRVRGNLALKWSEYRKAWAQADMIYEFVDHYVKESEVPAFIAHEISPDDADRWSLVGCHEAERVALCLALASYRKSLGDGYIALVASAWGTKELQFVLPMLSNIPDLTREILAYQEAGWSPTRIVRLMRAEEAHVGAPGLPLPPPELEVEAEMPAGLMPLADIDGLIGGRKTSDASE